MSKTFRAWKIDQPLLLPLAVQDFVANDHLARFVLGLIVDELDLIEIVATYSNEKGQPPFDPHMMTALLLYAYCRGIYSSRRIAQACRERVDFMSIIALDPPDFRTISNFRKRHLTALAGLFVQVLKLCEKAGLVKLGHVALDGTKIKANASKHKAMRKSRLAVTTAPTGCASSCPNRYSGRSSRRAGSANSCYGDWKRCTRNGALSAPPTIC